MVGVGLANRYAELNASATNMEERYFTLERVSCGAKCVRWHSDRLAPRIWGGRLPRPAVRLTEVQECERHCRLLWGVHGLSAPLGLASPRGQHSSDVLIWRNNVKVLRAANSCGCDRLEAAARCTSLRFCAFVDLACR